MKNKVLIIICAVLLVLSICGTIIGFVNKDNKKEEENKTVETTEEVEKDEYYPDFTRGYTIKMVQKFTNENGISLSIEHKPDNVILKGGILSQSKQSGSKIEEGDELTIYVSDGKPNSSAQTSDLEEIEDEDSEEDEEDINSSEYKEDTEVIGILFNGYRPFKNLKYQNTVNGILFGETYGKVYVGKDKVEYQDFHVDGKKRSIKAPGIKSAAIICDCGFCTGILYINSSNDLYYVDISDEGDSNPKKIGSNMLEFADVSSAYVFPSTCNSNMVAIKDNNGNEYLHNPYEGEKIYPLKEMERDSVELAGVDDGDFGSWDRIVYIVSENAKVDEYLLDNNNKKVNAKAVVDGESDFWVISEDNYVYSYKITESPTGGTYGHGKIKTMKKTDNGLEITWEDGDTELLEGTVYLK